MNYAFYVSGNAGRLRKIIDNKFEVLKNTKVVISDSDSTCDLSEKLKYLGIDFKYFNYKKQKGINEKLSEFILNIFMTYKVDYCFCFGDHILKGKLLETYKNKIINFHPSILPLYPGRKAIDQAVKDDATILLGNTAHFIDEGVDTGPIIMQSVLSKDVLQKDNYNAVLDMQLPMLKLIYNSIQNDEMRIKDRSVFLLKKEGIAEPTIFYNTYE
jgi:phosphoribosylglycinamide formyltransferase-1